jgi:nitroimidazol reductase NimA-like FMN-containing flavoprotein (pyridoxamine 5'-phosphate oxidase superfamily)
MCPCRKGLPSVGQRTKDPCPQDGGQGRDQTRRVLETAELFWISAVRADDRPHVTPLVAVWLGDAIHFHTGAEEQKFADLRTNRRWY